MPTVLFDCGYRLLPMPVWVGLIVSGALSPVGPRFLHSLCGSSAKETDIGSPADLALSAPWSAETHGRQAAQGQAEERRHWRGF